MFLVCDGCLLHRSSEVIQPLYQEWEGVDEEEEEERGEGEDDEYGDVGSLTGYLVTL